MKTAFVILFYINAISTVWAQSNIIELPFEKIEGYGPFVNGYIIPSWEDSSKVNEWTNTYIKLKGLPRNWQQLKQGRILIDNFQYVFQNAQSGKLSKEFYEDLQKNWNWTPDPKTLSVRPIQCYVYVITGLDNSGKRLAMLDSNNNLDFSDEQAFEPSNAADVNSLNTIHEISYELFYKNKIKSFKTNLGIWKTEDGVRCSFPSYLVANYITDGSPYQIAVVSSNFTNPAFFNTTAIVLNDTTANIKMTDKFSKKLFPTLMSKEGEYFKISQSYYKYIGVDLVKNVLQIQPANKYDSLYSTQVGYRAPLFKNKDFFENKDISLLDLRGKYVLIDFWGTWCLPCRQELPYLKEAYNKTDRSLIVFLGVVSHDTPETLKKYVEKNQIEWPQIISDSLNNLVDLYKIKSYPATVLIDPNGKILVKNLRGTNLVNVLTKLQKK
ncbi:TlpA family protein disulfide reductase [Spirosoma arboris]|nr:TlpA disulfide reductase family protein [Spirosoma arboris]